MNMEKTIVVLRWTARSWSIASLGLLALFVIREGLPPLSGQALLFPGGLALGLVLAWRHERLGGAVAAMSMALFYALEFLLSGAFPRGFGFLLFAGPSIFFILSGMLERRSARRQRPSQTAYKVAMNILSLDAKPGMGDVLPRGIIEATERLLVASGTARLGTVRFARSRMAVTIYEAFDWMMPGQFEAFAHRKAFCERQVRSGIAEAASQVLILGAGYDTLGWRLAPEFPNVRFFEIDHPATSRFKAIGIKAMGQPENLRLLAEDLGRRRLIDVLRGLESWDLSAATVIIAEGLLMYLAPEAVRDLFAQCEDATGAGSRMAFSHVGTKADGRPDAGKWTGLVMWLLRTAGEPWLWSVSPEDLPHFLGKSGWKVVPEAARSVPHRGVEFFRVVQK
ncbi:class I SAM-dependent methyltransferase [Elusimicrobiota bacterium]